MRIWSYWLLLAVLCAGAGTAAAAAPRLGVDKEVFDFGTILQGEKVETIFRLRNDGDAPLLVDRVKTSCGCTAALLSASVLAPGESGEVSTTFDSARFSGSVQKTISVYSNDPERPVLQLTVKGSIRQELLLSPTFVELGNLKPGVEKIMQVVIRNQGTRPINLREVKVLASDLTGELSAPLIEAGASATLTLHALPAEGRSMLNGYVIVYTDSKRSPELRIPVYGRIEAPVPTVTPAGK